MKILAFDPGYERLGVAVVEKVQGKEHLLFSDCIHTSAKQSFPERLQQLGAAAETLFVQWAPDAVAIEELYFEKNAKTAIQVAQVSGMLTYLAAKAGVPLYQYTPLQIKVATTGYGHSDKKAVAAMVVRLVSVGTKKRLDDELDAIAVGLTCLASLRN